MFLDAKAGLKYLEKFPFKRGHPTLLKIGQIVIFWGRLEKIRDNWRKLFLKKGHQVFFVYLVLGKTNTFEDILCPRQTYIKTVCRLESVVCRWSRSTREPSSSDWAGCLPEDPRVQVRQFWEGVLFAISLNRCWLPCLESVS